MISTFFMSILKASTMLITPKDPKYYSRSTILKEDIGWNEQ